MIYIEVEIIRSPLAIGDQPGPEASVDRQAYHHGDLRAALMSAALALIERHGVKSFTLKDAAVMAGVSTAAPYRHFADKNALLRAIQLDGFQRFNAALAEAFNGQSEPEAQLLELGVAYVRFALGHPAHFRVMFGLQPDESLEPEPGKVTGYDLLVRGVDGLFPGASGETRMDRVIGCWSAVHGFVLLHLDGALQAMVPMADAEAQLRRMLRLVMAR